MANFERQFEYDLALLNCGGTASQFRELAPSYKLRQMSPQELIGATHGDTRFEQVIAGEDVMPGLNSSDIDGEDLRRLATRLGELNEQARSAVVLMGVNTAPYVASYMAFALRGMRMPVVFAAGQRHHGRDGSDSALNIGDAFQFALAASDFGSRGIYIHSGLGRREYYWGVGAQKVGDNDYWIFESPCISRVGYRTPHDVKIHPSTRLPYLDSDFQVRNFGVENIMLSLNVVPNFNPEAIDLFSESGSYTSLALSIYEHGNVQTSLLAAIQRAVFRGKHVIIRTAFREKNLTDEIPVEDQNIYDRLNEYGNSGAVVAPGNMTDAALWAKIGFYSTYKDSLNLGSLASFLKVNYVGEIPPDEFVSIDIFAKAKRSRSVHTT